MHNVASGTVSQVIELTERSNEIQVVVTAEDGVTTKTYTLALTLTPTITFSESIYLMNEVADDTRDDSVTLTLNISPPLGQASTVGVVVMPYYSYSYQATLNEDYTVSGLAPRASASGEIAWDLALPADASSVSFSLHGVADGITDGNEGVWLELKATTGAPYGFLFVSPPTHAEVGIYDNSKAAEPDPGETTGPPLTGTENPDYLEDDGQPQGPDSQEPQPQPQQPQEAESAEQQQTAPESAIERIGTNGPDDLEGGNGNDLLVGKQGPDTLRGHEGNDELRGGKDSDDLRGGRGADTLYGGNGNDRLSGGRGADRLLGGDGDDTYIGGPGADRFIFLSGETGDKVITDFGDGDDRIVLKTEAGSWPSVSDIIAGVVAQGDKYLVYTLSPGLTVETDVPLGPEDFRVN